MVVQLEPGSGVRRDARGRVVRAPSQATRVNQARTNQANTSQAVALARSQVGVPSQKYPNGQP